MAEMLPYIMDTAFNTVGVIDDYISFIWTTRYYATGDFELQTDITDKARELLKKDYYVWREDDENIGVIERVRIVRDEEEHETLIVSGRFLSCILSRRIIAQNVSISGTFSDVVNQMITTQAINPEIEARKIPGLTLGNYSVDYQVSMQYDGENLLESIEELCETYMVGQKTTFGENGSFVFQLYNGVDRSYNQDVNPYVIFSGQYDNLASSDYEENYGGMVTDMLVIGAEDETTRLQAWVSRQENNGLARYENYMQANDAPTDGSITEQEFWKMLEDEGAAKLTSFTSAFAGNVYFDNVQYRKDVFMGDIVTIENSEWGIYINARIVEIIESVGEDGKYTVTPTFAVGTASETPGGGASYIAQETKAANYALCPFPVGYVMQMANGTNPNTLYPGTTWQQISGVFLLASSNNHALGATGGAETVKLTAAESGVPAHTHRVQSTTSGAVYRLERGKASYSGTSQGYYAPWFGGGYSAIDDVYAVGNTAADASKAHNNMPPYKVVNVWERTA